MMRLYACSTPLSWVVLQWRGRLAVRAFGVWAYWLELTLQGDPLVLRVTIARVSVETGWPCLPLVMTVLGICRPLDHQFGEQDPQRGDQHNNGQCIRNQAGDDQKDPCHQPRDFAHQQLLAQCTLALGSLQMLEGLSTRKAK